MNQSLPLGVYSGNADQLLTLLYRLIKIGREVTLVGHGENTWAYSVAQR